MAIAIQQTTRAADESVLRAIIMAAKPGKIGIANANKAIKIARPKPGFLTSAGIVIKPEMTWPQPGQGEFSFGF